MQDVEFSDSFVPLGAPSGTTGIPSTTFYSYARITYSFNVISAVTIGPGINWGDLYNIVDTKAELLSVVLVQEALLVLLEAGPWVVVTAFCLHSTDWVSLVFGGTSGQHLTVR